MACLNHPDILTGLDRCSRCGKDFCEDCLISLQGALVCPGCKGERVLDIRSGTGAKLDLAGAGARFGAAIVDGIIMSVPLYTLAYMLGIMKPKEGDAVVFGTHIGFLVLSLFMPAIYEGVMLSMRGQTVGKMAIKAKVVNADGSPLTGAQPWKRAFSRTLMSATYILGLIDVLMIFSKDRATLHDRIAATRVVRVN